MGRSLLTRDDVEAALRDAIWDGRLAGVAAELAAAPHVAEEGRALAAAAVACCETIAAHNRRERERMAGRLADAGVAAVAPDGDPPPGQVRAFELRIAPADVAAAFAAAAAEGYHAPDAAGPPQQRPAATLVNTDGLGTRMTLRWANRPSGPRALARRVWAARPGARPPAGPGIYLPTPDELISPLLDFAGVGSGDTLVDLGCGDGRVIVEAARRHGCRGLGVEVDADLVALARRRVATASLGRLVRIEQGDLAAVRLDGATALFAFLPAGRLAGVVDRLGPGMRLVAHEQARLPLGLHPDRSRPLVGRAAVTVAHLWTAR